MADKAKERREKFIETLELKRKSAEIAGKLKELKAYWVGIAAAELEGGQGKILVMPEEGHGVSIKKGKGSPSTTKLRELGVAEETLEAARGESLDWELF